MTDDELRQDVYRRFAAGDAPRVDPEAGTRLGFLVDDDGTVLIANPFAGRETPFVAEAEGSRFHANCVWDALGILALLDRDGRAVCEGIELRVDGGELAPTDAVCHFLVPARDWYRDLAHT